MFNFLNEKKSWYFFLAVLIALYLLTHLLSLTFLPVFADEAIYIRWSQLIIDDWRQYLFFPLNDGKTPLQMWLMVPLIRLFPDPLFAGRLLSVIVGMVQVFVIGAFVRSLGGKRLAQAIGMILVTVLPFWYFHHRMALIDGVLTLGLACVALGLVNIIASIEVSQYRKATWWTVFTGICFAASLWTKVPALFLSPVFTLFVFLPTVHKRNIRQVLSYRVMYLGAAGLLGLLLFLTMKLHPAFGQLFGRGEDFTFSLNEVLAGQWKTSIDNVVRVTYWNGSYLSYGVLVACVLSLFLSKHRQRNALLLLSAVAFASPFIIFGKVLAPRYFVPVAIFLTTLTALTLEECIEKKRLVHNVITGLVILSISLTVIPFLGYSLLDPDKIPFVANDREQYLTEWSSGHGIKEATQFILEASKYDRIFVSTEGFFGTLPDGILMYLHNQDVTNVEVIGIGQPIFGLPEEVIQKGERAKHTYVIVNSHRFSSTDPRFTRVVSYPRPYSAPTLDVYEFTNN